MNSGYAVQRRYPRVAAENVVLVKRLGPQPLEGFTKTRVMGLGGCMFISDEFLGTGSRLEVLLSFSGRVVQTAGRIVYEIPKGEDEIEIGVEFLDVSATDRKFLWETLHPGETMPVGD